MIAIERKCVGNSLVVQWLGLGDFIAKGQGSIPDWGTPTSCTALHRRKQRERMKKGSVKYPPAMHNKVLLSQVKVIAEYFFLD